MLPDSLGRLPTRADARPLPLMRLWEVSRWGNGEDPDLSHDTNFLVVAPDHETAARLVEARRVRATVIYDLGVCHPVASEAEARVIRGPYLANKYNTHFFTEWLRDEEMDVWVPTPYCRDGVARCAYADGAPAAEIHYAAERPHGTAERWYPDGTPFYRGTYERGNAVGVHERWYADGRLASRHEHLRIARSQVQLTYTHWNREGEIVDQGTETHRLRHGPRG